MSSYHELNEKTARRESGEFLHQAMNDCRPDSGAYLAAKHELIRRQENTRFWRKIALYLLAGLIGLGFAGLAWYLGWK